MCPYSLKAGESSLCSCSHVSVKRAILHSRYSFCVLLSAPSSLILFATNLKIPVRIQGRLGLNFFCLSLRHAPAWHPWCFSSYLGSTNGHLFGFFNWVSGRAQSAAPCKQLMVIDGSLNQIQVTNAAYRVTSGSAASYLNSVIQDYPLRNVVWYCHPYAQGSLSLAFCSNELSEQGHPCIPTRISRHANQPNSRWGCFHTRIVWGLRSTGRAMPKNSTPSFGLVHFHTFESGPNSLENVTQVQHLIVLDIWCSLLVTW